MENVICPECDVENPANAMNCMNCRINLRFALEHPDQIKDAEPTATPHDGTPAQQATSRTALTVLRWVARIASVVFIVVFVLMFASEGFDPAKITPREWVSLAFFPIGVVVGMILAWWKEGLGGAITVVSLLATYFVGDVSRSGGGFMLVCASPGFLFLLCWFLSKTTGKTNDTEREILPEPIAGLTEEEKEVLHLLSEDLHNLEIADRLGISAVQASLITSELLTKFRVDNKGELINQARQKGYLQHNLNTSS